MQGFRYVLLNALAKVLIQQTDLGTIACKKAIIGALDNGAGSNIIRL